MLPSGARAGCLGAAANEQLATSTIHTPRIAAV
jgi:hypothetical protein